MKLKRISEGLDLSAAIWAGLLAGILFLLSLLMLTNNQLGENELVWRMIAAMVQGEGALDPVQAIDGGLLSSAIVVHLAISVFYGVVIALIIHRWGLIAGLLGGAILGLALYAINFYTFSFFFPWFFPFRSWMMVVSHLIFGAVAGGTYELLEVEEFVPVEVES